MVDEELLLLIKLVVDEVELGLEPAGRLATSQRMLEAEMASWRETMRAA